MYRYPLNRRLGGAQSRSGSFEEEVSFLEPNGIQNPNPSACSLVAIPTALLQRIHINILVVENADNLMLNLLVHISTAFKLLAESQSWYF
jgi:hypothetical protein